MANRNHVDVSGYAAIVFDILEADGARETDDSVAPAIAAALDAYVGSYDWHPWDGEDLVFRWKDSLAMVTLPTMDPIGKMVMLEHIDGDRFHTVRKDEQAGHEVVFRRDAPGQVSHIVYHSLNLPKFQ